MEVLGFELEILGDKRPHWECGQSGVLYETTISLTFFEAGVSAEADLLPNVAHRVRAADLRPVLEEEFHLDLARTKSSVHRIGHECGPPPVYPPS